MTAAESSLPETQKRTFTSLPAAHLYPTRHSERPGRCWGSGLPVVAAGGWTRSGDEPSRTPKRPFTSLPPSQSLPNPPFKATRSLLGEWVASRRCRRMNPAGRCRAHKCPPWFSAGGGRSLLGVQAVAHPSSFRRETCFWRRAVACLPWWLKEDTSLPLSVSLCPGLSLSLSLSLCL